LGETVMDEILTRKLHELASNCGADLFGVANANDFSEYTDKHNPYFYVDSAKSVIVIGYQIGDTVLDALIKPINGKGYVYFINEILGNIAHEIISVLLLERKKAILSPNNGIFAKDTAVLAGLGTIGKNNLLITEKFGSHTRLRTIVTDAELCKTYGKPKYFCDNCSNLCWSACPANAFSEGRYNKGACFEYTKSHVKKLSENAILGCRECELACPAFAC
ncbi:MAG: hypothetical protein NTY22_04690, partial [Proteobacteria bacterium]|nr:hypothetical protein [Pseudomonadota bacterium]